jgi:uncharacterized membrane protein YhiD involved in acid resistance|tara:strand:+ start:688 stop:1371 length:684 start_codon:yes stop_codon:yes gene_type:complete
MLDVFRDSVGNTVDYTPLSIFVNLMMAFALGIIMSLAYKSNHKGLSYSQSLVFSFVLLSIAAACVIMVIGNNLARAFGLVGALSIIRFRTVVKDTKDTAYVFFALAIGLASGTSLYTIAVISTVVFIAVDTILTRTNFASIRKHEYIVRFSFNPQKQTDDAYKDAFERHLVFSHLVDLNVISDDNIEYSYNMQLKKDTKLNEFVGELNKIEGMSNINIVTSKMDIEY